jgi:hypothetical protein
MQNSQIDHLVSILKEFGSEGKRVYHGEELTSLLLGCFIEPPIIFNSKEIEDTLKITLPSDLLALWFQVSSMRLFMDIESFLWGLEIASPEKVVEIHKMRKSVREWDYREGDLIIGEFIGDADTLVIRCNKTENDFGSVLIGLEIDNREDWLVVAHSLSEFLKKYVDANGNKFWTTC